MVCQLWRASSVYILYTLCTSCIAIANGAFYKVISVWCLHTIPISNECAYFFLYISASGNTEERICFHRISLSITMWAASMHANTQHSICTHTHTHALIMKAQIKHRVHVCVLKSHSLRWFNYKHINKWVHYTLHTHMISIVWKCTIHKQTTNIRLHRRFCTRKLKW